MNTEALEKAFAKMGARVKLGKTPRVARPWRSGMPAPTVTLDVSRDGHGEYFFIRRDAGVELEVLDVQPKDRHLVLLSREARGKARYLLGHDERHWFVAAIPEVTPVTTVRAAKEALKPKEVATREVGIATKHRARRKNEARIRQGEWFFVPEPSAVVDPKLILRNEPLVRSRGGKPHFCEELFRYGGETVYVGPGAYREGVTQAEYDALDKKERDSHSWTIMRRNPQVLVRGKVRHSDHATIVLNGWHRVYSNTETLSYAMRNVVFLD